MGAGQLQCMQRHNAVEFNLVVEGRNIHISTMAGWVKVSSARIRPKMKFLAGGGGRMMRPPQ
jgi:hypothetical protein